MHIGDGFLEQLIIGRNGDNRHGLINQRNRPVLQFTGGKTLGMDIRDFFQLQRALKRQRPHSVAADKQGAGIIGEAFGNLFDLSFARQHIIGEARRCQQQVRQARFFGSVNRAFNAPQTQGERCQRAKLCGEGFG